jgi:mediator of RNA polymerase II transcription subunit 5
VLCNAEGILSHGKLKRVADTAPELRKSFSQALSSFIPFLSHSSIGSQNSLQIATRLELSQKQHDFHEKSAAINGEINGDTGLEVAALQLGSVMDLPSMNTRAGLYIFFNSLVSTTSLTIFDILMNA